MAGAKRGRPTKCTEGVQGQIVSAIRGGATRTAAARWANVDLNTLSKWLRWGEEGKSRLFAEFRRAVNEAEASAEVLQSSRLFRAADHDWRAALAWLERKRPDEWGRKDRHEFVGEGGRSLIPIDLLRAACDAALVRAPVPPGTDDEEDDPGATEAP